MTRKWCSPEVAADLPRGRASDIFSLGCVFIQMYTTLLRMSLSDFDDFRAQESFDDSFQSNLPRVRQWISKMRNIRNSAEQEQQRQTQMPIAGSISQILPERFLDLAQEMIDEQPERRPKSDEMLNCMEKLRVETPHGHAWRSANPTCCARGREEYQVAEEDRIFDAFKFSGLFREDQELRTDGLKETDL